MTLWAYCPCSGEFYGPNFGPDNLELLARFYDKYPDYVDKTVLCVKVRHTFILINP